MNYAAELREALEKPYPWTYDPDWHRIVVAARERLAQMEADPELRAQLLRAITGVYDDIAIVDAVLDAISTPTPVEES